MASLTEFYKKRLGSTFSFSFVIIFSCVFVGIVLNIMDSRGYEQSTVDDVGGLAIFLILLISTIVIVKRRPLPGILGKWQALFKSIPTLSERRAEEAEEKKRSAKKR